MNRAAQALGRRAKGKPKTMTDAAIVARQENAKLALAARMEAFRKRVAEMKKQTDAFEKKLKPAQDAMKKGRKTSK